MAERGTGSNQPDDDARRAAERERVEEKARDLARKVGGTAFLLMVLAGMASHPMPGSIDSLLRGATYGLPVGVVAAAVAWLVVTRQARRTPPDEG